MKHTAKTLKRVLKKAGLKCSGSKATLRSRAKRAKLIRGGGTFSGVGAYPNDGGVGSGGRRRRRGCKKHSSMSSESSSDSD